MTTLVAGASGATGRSLVELLLQRGQHVKVIVRSIDKLPSHLMTHESLSIIEASILDMRDQQMAQSVQDCDAVVSCLGHNLTWKGIFGHPRRLVTEATRRLCQAIKATQPMKPMKFVLMNTAGNSNRDLKEKIVFAEKCIIGLIRLLVPPHADNEQAADYLRQQIGQNDKTIEWTVVRPDSLTNEEQVTEYELHPSPTRSAIFNAGRTSRINVAHCMVELITNEETWKKWRGQMPVIYNKITR